MGSLRRRHVLPARFRLNCVYVVRARCSARAQLAAANERADRAETILKNLVESADAAEDAGDFVLWVQEKLASWRKS